MHLPDRLASGLAAAERLLAHARKAVSARIAAAGGGPAAFDAEQMAAHGYAWMATYVRALRQMVAWITALESPGEIEVLIAQVAFGEYCAQLAGGLPMSQNEIVRPVELGVPSDALEAFAEATRDLVAAGCDPAKRIRLAALAAVGQFGDPALDATLAMIRDQFRRFSDEQVAPYAHQWHLADQLIPIELVEEMSAMGVFGLTIPEAHGGSGLGKIAMAIVSEELSRGYIGVGSLGTRAEIAAELIMTGGTPEQQARYLPAIASGAILTTAVFTEPDTGSDLGALTTRALRDGDRYRITGAKTWITHAARSDLMTLLARTGPADQGWRTLSMFLAEKPRGTDADPFPAEGITGGEIRVLGYRGMREYELGFDGFEVPAGALLGGQEGHGFKQLMATFESARVQTAARAVGVAQNALELGLAYAQARLQFGRPLLAFPRVAAKLGMMVAETMVARQLTWFAAREKDGGRRCDVEAGMAKLLAARVAWANADNALQIHGGNGYAIETPISRVLCDARILNIFEGAAEVQAQVIARRLLAGGN